MYINEIFRKIFFVIFPLCLCLVFCACPEPLPDGIVIKRYFDAEGKAESINLDGNWKLSRIQLDCKSSEGKDSIIYDASFDRFFERTIEDSLCLDNDSVYVETCYFCVYKDKTAPNNINVKMKKNDGRKRGVTIYFWRGENPGQIWGYQDGLSEKWLE